MSQTPEEVCQKVIDAARTDHGVTVVMYQPPTMTDDEAEQHADKLADDVEQLYLLHSNRAEADIEITIVSQRLSWWRRIWTALGVWRRRK